MWDDPWLYDLENADDPEFDLEFWAGLVERLRPARVLELACGTGRLTAPLARAGLAVRPDFSLVGVDSSGPFLARARERVAAVGPAVSLVESDMRAPDVDGEFDLVIVPFNSLAYLVGGAGDRAAALTAARSLVSGDGGVFALDLVAPRYDLLAEATVRPPVVRQDANHAASEYGVTRLLRTSTDTYDPSTQTLHSLNRYEIHRTDGRVEHRVTDLDWHIWFPAELELALDAADFEVTERYGGYDGSEWRPSASRILWVCAPR
jgi:SAM-dependent methyltransferase